MTLLASAGSQIDAAQLVELVPVPEPTLFTLLSLGVCGCALLRRRGRRLQTP